MRYKLCYDSWDNKELLSINKVIKSGFFTMGKNVKEFEKKFAKYLGRKYAVMTNSGSSANLIGVASQFYLKKNNLKANDEVIVPAISWSTSYAPLQQYGLNLKVIDVDPNNLNIDISKIKSAITNKTKMICAVNILGVPAELFEIKKICKKHNLILFEDNCESLGAEINGKKTGSFGDFSTHSFFYSHHISTMEGGMVVTDNFETYCLLKVLRAHGWSRDLPELNPITKKIKNEFFEEYKFILPGYNVRPSELNAASGLVQLKKLDGMIKGRTKNLKLFNQLFKDDKRFIIQKTNYKNSSFCFPMIIRNNKKGLKEKIIKKLKLHNIDFRLITGGCFTEHKYIKHFKYSIHGQLINSKKAHYDGFFIGNSNKDLSKEIKKLHKVLLNV